VATNKRAHGYAAGWTDAITRIANRTEKLADQFAGAGEAAIARGHA
jgi:hypothetical protein